MELFFVGGYDKERLISKPSNITAANKNIYDFLSSHNYKSYYTRNWWSSDNNGTLNYDVGCHTQFFELRGIPKEIVDGYLKESTDI